MKVRDLLFSATFLLYHLPCFTVHGQFCFWNIFFWVCSNFITTPKNQAANKLLFSYWKNYLTFSFYPIQSSFSDLKSSNLNSLILKLTSHLSLKHLTNLCSHFLWEGSRFQQKQRLSSIMTGWESNFCYVFHCFR